MNALSSAARAVLDRRASVLARPLDLRLRADAIEMVTFRLGAEDCCVQASAVLNVFRLTKVTLIPGAPAPIHGVTLWRGEVLTLVDIRATLAISTTALTDLGRVIVVGASRAAFGFLVDSLSGTRAVAPAEIHKSLTGSTERPSLARGVTSDGMLVLDVDVLLKLVTPD